MNEYPHYMVTLANTPQEAQDWLNRHFEMGYELVSVTHSPNTVAETLLVVEMHSLERLASYQRNHQYLQDETPEEVLEDRRYCPGCGLPHADCVCSDVHPRIFDDETGPRGW